MSKLILYHGSQKIVEKPLFGAGKPYNDYGLGFYCTQNIELAKEWACPVIEDGFANCYELETEGLLILDLQKETFCIYSVQLPLMQKFLLRRHIFLKFQLCIGQHV